MLYKRYILHIIIDNNDIKTDIAVANNKAQPFLLLPQRQFIANCTAPDRVCHKHLFEGWRLANCTRGRGLLMGPLCR